MAANKKYIILVAKPICFNVHIQKSVNLNSTVYMRHTHTHTPELHWLGSSTVVVLSKHETYLV